MEFRLDPRTREQLARRRMRLVEALEAPAAPRELDDLLRRVDDALARFDRGAYGICELCAEPVEEAWIRVDPLTRFCLDHLDAAAQRALERDLSLAAEVQRTLLPRTDLRAGEWEIHYRYDAVGPVSGDYCDVVVSADPAGGILVAVGDVSGKGVAASLLSAHLNALFRGLDDVGLAVPEMLRRANRLFCESTLESQYATLVVGRACGGGAIELCNAGQGPPMLVRGGRVEPLRSHGLPLGMFCDAPYASETVHAGPGDAIAMYTDGITESRDPEGEEFGARRLAETLAGVRPSARAYADACLQALDRHRAGAPPIDDRTLLVLRRLA